MTDQETVLRCPTCNGTRLKRGGFTDNGKRIRYRCNDCDRRTTNPINATPTPDFYGNLPDGEKFVITCAQNATPVFRPFWDALLNYCKAENAQLICVPIRYKNPTSQQEAKRHTEDFEWWAQEVVPYLYSMRVDVHEKLTLLGDLRINPTAVRPLSGLDSITGPNSGIVPHPKVELRSIASPHHKMPKLMVSTGAATLPQYSQTKAGARAEFSHSYSAVVVERDGDRFHIRHLNAADDGSFIDLDKKYTSSSVESVGPAEALIVGDTHVGFTDKGTTDALFLDDDCLFNHIRPKRVVLHDLTDNYSRSHHHTNDPFLQVGKHKFGWDSVKEELDKAAEYIDECIPSESEVVLPASNHPEAISRWLKESDWKKDPQNAEFYLRTALELVENLQWTEYGVETVDPFAEYLKNNMKTADRCRFLDAKECYDVKDIEIGMHGHRGPNGARGSINNLSKLGTKSVIGHGHCLTDRHDVLTRNGWRPIAEVPPQQELLSYNFETGTNVWGYASQKHETTYSGYLIEIQHAHAFCQEVTPKHKMRLKDGSDVNICEAILTRSASDVPLSADSVNSGDLYEDESVIRKVVAACADGNFYLGSLRFNLKKKRKIDRLLALFGEDARRPRTGNYNGFTKITIRKGSKSHNEITKYISPTTAGKVLPPEFINLDPTGRKVLIDELRCWDGTFKNKDAGSHQFSTAKYEEANLISSLLTMEGYRNFIFTRSDRDSWVICWGTNKDHSYVTQKQYKKVRQNGWGHDTKIVNKEPVYCFTIEKYGCFWVKDRKTGLVSVTGNSPGIQDGCYQVGTSALKMGYAAGAPSSWLSTHCIIYENGKRTLINVIDGKWRG